MASATVLRTKVYPGQYFKRKWKHWCPGSASYGQVYNPNAGTSDNGTSYRGGGGINPEMTTADAANPNPTEQVVAREGERGGMDMVVEFPETQDEQETRREDQMDALYQLRVQRRQQAADRETRRNERRAARARGDSVRLQELAAESRARNNRARGESNTSLSASAVIAEHQARERDRRISSVSYADIGHVRHDGSRLRADSHDSDHHPLLQNASLNISSPSLVDPSMHSRGESMASKPTPQTDEEDIGNLNIVPPPPEYDHLEWGDAPAYESPTRERADDSNRPPPLLTRLPSIHVNIASPITISPVFPSGLPSREDENRTPTPPDPTSIPAPSDVSDTQEEHTGSTDSHPPVSR
ncbi:hypothetical protein N7509_013626 [Penicillium cosmopolitanum]|uniref:Uncharacterized protein n=1 Tax=Penicillium cosmopolitanum TaxID=1131564 RepID=A0A9W9SEV9_9EURO|nr:uncharacterized protein N7509_013626 [Penicillium cosmopolitanum]KAJ5376740.1 hypothetical protein N7509_013626 [Penicillium cosmopolitanum]